MSLQIEAGSAGPAVQRELAKKGPRVAILTGIIDLGMQPQEYGGEKKPDCREFLPILTLVNDKYTDSEGVERCMVMSPWPIKLKLGDRANYPKFCAAFDPNGDVCPAGVGNVNDLLGRPVFAVVTHSNGKGDKAEIVYSNIKGVQELPEDYPVPEMDLTFTQFDASNPDQAVFDNLYDRTQELITSSPSWKGFGVNAKVLHQEEEATQANAPAGEGSDDSPF